MAKKKAPPRGYILVILIILIGTIFVYQTRNKKKDLSEYAVPGYTYLKSNNPNVESIEAIKFPEEKQFRRFIREKIDPITKVAPKTKEDITWLTYNSVGFIDPDVRYSFKFPYHGPYCEGCFDGWPYNNSTGNVEGHWITGGYFNPDNIERLWSLSSGIVYRKIPATVSKDAELNPYLLPMIENMLKTPIGGKVTITDRYDSEKHTALRLADSTSENTFAMYKTNNPQEQYYALLDNDSYVVVFTYSYSDKTYDVFDEVLKSFQFSLREDATNGQLSPVDSLDGFARVDN